MSTIQETPYSIDVLVAETSKQSRREAESLRDHLKKLPEKRWLNQSFCTDWTIKDVVEHQAAQGLAMRTATQAALQGKEPNFSPEGLQAFVRQLEGLNRLELADLIAQTTHEMFDLLERATPEQLQKTTQTRFGKLALHNLGSFRLSELSLHSWDIRVVDDLTAKVSRESLPLLLPGLVAALPGLAHPETVQQLPALTYQFEVAGPVKGPIALSVAQNKVQAQRDYAEKPDVVLKLDSEAFLRLTWGRLNLKWMIRDGWVKVEGDQEKALKLNEIFQGV
jgi:uncharacterized protein (TIGR03083 family)